MKHEDKDTGITRYYVNGISVSKKTYEKELVNLGIKLRPDAIDTAYENQKT